jgi:hypothetical protein
MFLQIFDRELRLPYTAQSLQNHNLAHRAIAMECFLHLAKLFLPSNKILYLGSPVEAEGHGEVVDGAN